ncbi:hypothetical protein [Sphingomonas psychrotolerans]|uniref:Uncharacterized protein n=1 Tax=Sphingomonas psychrotolerans TaxID=1327635 RepID=A0A2K8MB94_9SPHN|nr:hypothetical protein [Sphingomonas psychrotolerans]ATY31148.1 hypothetical protein CVN68_03435 [Sphingomonas psychrotolerans]
MRHLLPALLCTVPLLCSAAPPRTVTIQNRTANVLRGVYLSPASVDAWGPDRATENVRIKGKLTLPLPGPGCRWDVRVLLGNRPGEQIFRNRDLCRNPVITVDGRGRFQRGSETPRWN